MQISKYDRRHWKLFLLPLLAVIPFAVFVEYAMRTKLFGDNVWLTFGVFVVLGGAIWSLNFPWWRSLDDVHKQGQLTSWYWGGLTAGFVFLVWLVANNTQSTDYGRGAFHMILAQLGLALVLYGVWKWRGRGAPE